jgi:hypothetical protein
VDFPLTNTTVQISVMMTSAINIKTNLSINFIRQVDLILGYKKISII